MATTQGQPAAHPRARGDALLPHQLPDGRRRQRLRPPRRATARLRAAEAHHLPPPASDPAPASATGLATGEHATTARPARRRGRAFTGGIDQDPGTSPTRPPTAGRDPPGGAGRAGRPSDTISVIREQRPCVNAAFGTEASRERLLTPRRKASEK